MARYLLNTYHKLFYEHIIRRPFGVQLLLCESPLMCVHRWHVSEPGDCSAVCGPGEAKRVVSCVRPEYGQDVDVDQSFCSKQIKPPESVPCVVDVCPIGWESKGEVNWEIIKISPSHQNIKLA